MAKWYETIPAGLAYQGYESLFGGGGGYQGLEPYPGYFDMMSGVANQVRGNIGQPGPRYPGSFAIPQPAIEGLTEKVLGEKLSNLPSSAEYKAQVEASKKQQLAREGERAGLQREQEEGMYNRLGLVSSEPWLARAGKLGDESLMRKADIETGMDVYGLQYGLQADELANSIANQYLTQGQMLGAKQRGYAQYPIQMNYEDWVRSQNVPLQWAGLGAGMGQEPVYQSPPPGLLDYASELAPYLMMMAASGAGACWVADVLYGPQALQTIFARLYVATHDSAFLRAYRRHGKAWASWLARNDWAQRLVKPIWDNMAARGATMGGWHGIGA